MKEPTAYVYDPAENAELTAYFSDPPTLLEIDIWWAWYSKANEVELCFGDTITDTESETLATFFDGALVRDVDDAWCPRIPICPPPEDPCEGSGECGNCRGCLETACGMPDGEPFAVTWQGLVDDDSARLIVKRVAPLSFLAESIIDSDGVDVTTADPVEFPAAFDPEAYCHASDPVTLTPGCYQLEAMTTRDAKERTRGKRYVRIQ